MTDITRRAALRRTGGVAAATLAFPAAGHTKEAGAAGRAQPRAVERVALTDVLLGWQGDGPRAYTVEQIRGKILSLADFGFRADGASDERARLIEAIGAAAALKCPLYFPPTEAPIFIDNSKAGPIFIPDFANWVGTTSVLGGGSRLRFKGPAFTSDSKQPLSTVRIEGITFIGSDTNEVVGGGTGGNHGFELFAPTNNSVFRRVYVQWFNGDAFRIRRHTGPANDRTAAGNCLFEQTFLTSCGGYGFNVEGYITAVWQHPDINSCGRGAFRLAGGQANQTAVTITGLWSENTRPWTSRQPVLIEDYGNGPITFIGANFSGPTNGTDIIRVRGKTGARINLIGCAGFTYRNWIDDRVADRRVPYSYGINYFDPVLTAG